MAPPLLPLRHYTPSHVTEDTPPDLLEGTMDLQVTLPNGQTVIMTVHRSTPMMDLLIQVTTAHRINPGGHVIQVISDNIFLSYKPSTPIGTLETSAIKIVAKNTLNEMAKIRKSNLQQQAIERNIRLKPKEWVYKQQLLVNLPRNQLAVYRVPPKALISDIFTMVCEDKNLDAETHEIRHPVNVDERLRGSCSLSDYQLQEVCVVSSDFRPPPLSVTDLITMSSIAHPEDKKRRGIFGLFSRKAKSSTGDSSVSSGSAGERSVSPARSDESNEGRPTPQAHSPTSSSDTLTNLNHKSHTSVTAPSSNRNSFNSNDSSSHLSRPVSMISLNKNKKRQAPVPPQRVKRTTEGRVRNEKANESKEKPSLSRHSSDSSGYHESDIRSAQTSPSSFEVSSLEVTRSSQPSTNLTSVSNSSTTSLKGGKRKAPCPPKPHLKNGDGPSSIPESPEEIETNQVLSQDLSNGTKSPSLDHKTTSEVCEEFQNDKEREEHSMEEKIAERSSVKDGEGVENGHLEDSKEVLEANEDSKEVLEANNMSDIVEEKFSYQTEDSVDSHSLSKSNNQLNLEDKHNNDQVLESSAENSLEEAYVYSSKYPEDLRNSPSPTPVDLDNEIQTRTVSLSSETSSTSVEMLNPKDIQRPKRHRRKKIPEEFMSTSLTNGSSGSSHKNFERVDEMEEKLQAIKDDEAEISKSFHNDAVVEKEKPNIAQISLDNRINEANDLYGNVPDEVLTSDFKGTSKLSIVYVENVNEEESTTDPVSPTLEKKPVYTSKVELITSKDGGVSSLYSSENAIPEHKSVSVTQISSATVENLNVKQDVCKDSVIAELKSAIENNEDHGSVQPRILNFKAKEKKDWNIGRPSDYNVILSFKKSNSSSPESPVTRSSSVSSYESVENGSLKKSRSNTETSYESAPPPPPDSRPPLLSDLDSKASSSTVSRQSSFTDVDSGEFIKPKAPAFSISTYQSRASKISYDKKLARSESLASFKDLHGGDESSSKAPKPLSKDDSQRNEVYKSDSLKKKSTSTTFLNLCSNEWNDKNNAIRPSLIKSQSRSSLHEIGQRVNSKQQNEGTIQFDISSAKEPVTFSRTLPKTFNDLRKAKSTFDVRGNEGRIPESYQTIPDSGLANEYMRLQDDFMKWQNQLLQNQQLLHNRVAPIAANPPALNSVGRAGGGLRLGWKSTAPRMVNNMMNQAPANASTPQRKPVEITIPIRLVDSDEETSNETQAPKQSIQKTVNNQPISSNNGSRRSVPNVSFDTWQERPSNVVKSQPTVIEPPFSRPFGNQPRMQTVFQSAPQERPGSISQQSFQQIPQTNAQQNLQQQNARPIFQQIPQSSFQQVPQSSFQQVPQSSFQQVPQSSFQQVPQSSFQQAPQSSFQQVPQSSFQQMPQSSFQQMPQSSFQQMPQSSFQQMPQSGFQQMPQSGIQQMPQSSFQQMPQTNYQEIPQPTFQQIRSNLQGSQPTPQPKYQQAPETNYQQFAEPNTQFITKPYSDHSNQFASKPQIATSVDKNEDGINARFSSVVTLNNDKHGQNAPQKDKVRSIVQLNNSDSPQSTISAPFQSKIVNESTKIGEIGERERNGSPNFTAVGSSVAPMSSRLVQQAVQQPTSGGIRISPPKIERYSPSKTERPSPPPRAERQYSPLITERQISPPRHEPSPPFGEVKLRHVETRVSPPKNVILPQLPAPPPPPPPPSMNAAPPPPPPPPMSEEDRRTATGKKIFGAANVPQLDAREELMMAIRQFGGSGNLRKSPQPPLH